MNNKDRVERLKENISDIFELPKDITLNLPKLTMIGNIQVRIENHKGIIEYNEHKIRVNTKLGVFIIIGNKLFLRNIIKEEIVIEGNIHQVFIQE
ncbi:MAG: sporulation protein YqfC [Eubacteriales bacterium]